MGSSTTLTKMFPKDILWQVKRDLILMMNGLLQKVRAWMEYKKEQQFIFTLIHYALNQIKWNHIPETLDWKILYRLCRYHKIDNLVAYALDYAEPEIKNQIPAEVRNAFEQARQKGLARESTQYFALEEIQQKFEQHGISNIPLKGAQLKEYYPSPDMRFLTDLDILCDLKDSDTIFQIMTELGYTMDHGGEGHVVYVRKPFMTVEIHGFCNIENSVIDKIFEYIWDRCLQWSPYAFSYRMSWEDYYVYMMAHMAKHLKYSGIGIRMILDLYIFEKCIGKLYDQDYVKQSLKKAGVLQFSQIMSDFVGKCFNGEPLLPHEQILMEHIWETGAYGISENRMAMHLMKDGKSKKSILKNRILIAVRILFPRLKSMQPKYPYLKKYPFLLPVSWIQRLVKKTLFENKRSRKILKTAISTKNLDKMDQVCRAAGLQE